MATRATPEDYFGLNRAPPTHYLPQIEQPIEQPIENSQIYRYYYPAPQYPNKIDPTTMLILGITAIVAIVGIIALMKK